MSNTPARSSPCYHDILTLLEASPATKDQIHAGITRYKPRWIRVCLMELIDEQKIERVAVNGEMKNFLYRLKVKK